ncbi:BMP family ABC transporter substrate-binding protein [Sphaerochaeta sp. PS]|uniref:BMP family ABC transporter substrate-binding protein n=1 Tax=Sphaerochaeta sp. PS TaxID=3076336 RepID=UPI0028A350D7|nr:BMP family ABC transporter substrate-binding protein [Sphaerochaeta sp. PS]MDT4761100.1 BMP family ABC transporter substrate-binding protein [Sphaerochaeta sp. PS]
MKRLISSALMAVMVLSLAVATGSVEQKKETKPSLSVLVYITGVTAGSPPYTALAEGATKFAAEHETVSVKVYEAGFNQAQWEEQLTSLVATGEYDLVLGSNPSLPELCANVAKKFPKQKFVITDAYMPGNPQIRTYLYNQYEQSLFLGYLAGLVTTSDMPYANKALKIGFIAAQEYPLLNKHMVPGFLDGARMVNPNIEVDFRVIGNWFDANKAAELALSMINAGVDVFATISGGAAQGLFKVAKEQGAYIVFHNTNEYSSAPSLVVGCGSMEQEKLTMEILKDALDGTIAYGEATTVGVQQGYLRFISDDSAYTANLPQPIREKFDAFMQDIRSGKVAYTLPEL